MPREPLEAIMLVGGKGTRLRPLTLSAPKPLLPTAGVPFLAHQLARAAECGITHVVLATSYRAEMFTEAFGDGAQFGLSIDYVYEPAPLGTGGGIRNAATMLRGGSDDPIVVLNGDILSGHDLPAQVDLHRKKDAAVTLHLVPVEDPSRYGCVPTDASGRVVAFLEKTKNPQTNQINAGCYVFRRSVIDQIPAGEVVSVERATFPELIAAGATVLGYAEDAYWLDVGTPEAFVRGSCDIVLGALPSAAVLGVAGPSLVLGDAFVASGAQVTGGTTVGHRAVVESGAVVDGSVLFDGACVGSRTVVRNSIVGRDATIADGAVLDGVVVGDDAFVGPGNELARGLRLWPGTRLEATSVRFSSDALRRQEALMAEVAEQRDWVAPFVVDVRLTLGVQGRGRGDPTFQRDEAGSIWRTSLTPDGPGTIRVWPVLSLTRTRVRAQAWGPGARWLLDALPGALGFYDDISGFAAEAHPIISDAARRNPGLRLGKSARLMEALVPAILEQKVVILEAHRAWKILLHRFGTVPPGPAPRGMRVFPAPPVWRRIPSWEWHRAGVEGVRAETIIRAASVADSLERLLTLSHAEADRKLRTIPGIGVWTSAEARQRAAGDPDAVSVGDYHLKNVVGWALAGRHRSTDEEMLALLAPFTGHRHRATRLIGLSRGTAPATGAPALAGSGAGAGTGAGVARYGKGGPPRRGPRMSVRDYRGF